MKRLILSVTLLSILGGGLAAPVPKHLMPKPLYYHPTAIGATWIYEEGEHERKYVLSKVEDKKVGKLVTTELVVEEGPHPPGLTFLVSEDGLEWVSGENSSWMLRLPAGPDQQWEDMFGEKWTAKRIEKVEVPAGTYEAVRVDGTVSGNRRQKATTWYARGVGLIKSEIDGKTYERLMAFYPGKE